MRNLNANDMLNVWEQALDQPLLQKGLILLVAAIPEMQPDRLAELSIGQRDRHLLQLRERLFGQQMMNTTVCPECRERIEWESQVADLLIKPDGEHEAANEHEFVMDDYTLQFRLLNSLDMAAVVNSVDTETAQHHLLTRCLLKAEHSRSSCTFDQLPDSVIQQLKQRIEELDPQADVHINLSCPECSYSWDVLFDITSFLWTEINDWAERMLQMIHQLSSAYGWSEREILNLSPVRRQLYLGMLGS